MNKDTICAVPWMHLNFEPDSMVVPCCLTSHYRYYVGNLNTQSIDQIWNSDNMKTLRKEMLAGIEPKICDTCFNKERVTGTSGRINHNETFSKVIDIIPEITQPDGTCTTMELKYWDFRFSNLCNFKCRSCGPRYSSAWVPDAKKIGWEDQEKVWNIENVADKTNYDFLKDQINVVEKIYFAGGEPLLMDEHWYILDLLVEAKRFDVTIHYNTNASTLTYGKKNILDYWKQWQPGKIEVWPSIDEIGSRAELIRSGTVWPKVERNIIDISQLTNVVVRPGMTIGAWNVFRLPEIIEHLLEIGVISKKHDYQNWFINLLQYPSHYHVSILPDTFKEQIIEKIKSFIIEFEQKYKVDLTYMFSQIIFELRKPFNLEAAQEFVRMSKQLDQIREEDIYTTIPEMRIVLESLK
jgi:radical SAM protein with 4Fe4S-binding SPASM domain